MRCYVAPWIGVDLVLVLYGTSTHTSRYNTIFPTTLLDPTPLNRSPSVPQSIAIPSPTLYSVRHLSRRVLLLCDWAVTPYRNNSFSICILLASPAWCLFVTVHPFYFIKILSATDIATYVLNRYVKSTQQYLCILIMYC